MKPLPSVSLTAESIEDVERFRVDRVEELERCRAAIAATSSNIFIYGERGIGKTFLVRLLQDALTTDNTLLPVVVNLAHLSAYGRNELADSFPRAVLLQVCVKIWKSIFRKSYLDLEASVQRHESDLAKVFSNHAERTLVRVYGLLMLTEFKGSLKRASEIGASALIKGSHQETKEVQIGRIGILPFEFAEFLNVIHQDVLGRSPKRRIVAICDEANLLPSEQQRAILNQYLELFLSRQLQFVFVAGHHPWHQEPAIPSSFETVLRLEGFGDIRYVRELIEKVNPGPEYSIDDTCLNLLYGAFLGHPRDSLSAFQMSRQLAFDRSSASITPQIMKEAILYVKEEIDRYRVTMEYGS